MLPVGAYGLVACSGVAGELPTGSTAACSTGLSRLAQGLPPFLPASDACPEPAEGIDDQSHARGRCCHPCTKRIGVDVSHRTCYHLTYIDTQFLGYLTLPPHPPVYAGFGRTGRTGRMESSLAPVLRASASRRRPSAWRLIRRPVGRLAMATQSDFVIAPGQV
jgi:hypothetical protein